MASCVGVEWADLDLDAGRLVVRHTITSVKGQLIYGTPKTGRSRRTIDLDPMTAAILRAHRRVQLEQRMVMGSGWADLDLVFAQPTGEPWKPDTISQAFDRQVAALELPRIRFHDLRHTHASHLLASGVNVKVVSERLGHASVAFTLDVYAHTMPGQQADAAAEVAAMIDAL